MVSSSNIKKSLALSQLSCKIDDFSSEILELVNADSKGDLYATFVRNFLKYIPVDYRSRDKISLFGNFTHEAFEFFLHRLPNNRKIEIFRDRHAAEHRPGRPRAPDEGVARRHRRAFTAFRQYKVRKQSCVFQVRFC